jgi:6-pyruvoyltetrahydropterin/6-carboxytetrahydropterin synthase
MSLIRVTKEFSMEIAHALDHHDGKCKNIHGHSYQLAVTVLGTPSIETGNPKEGMVVDFADLKTVVNEQVVNRFDHALVLYQNSPFATKIDTTSNPRLVLVDYQPTCENMLLEMVEAIRANLPENVNLHSIRLRETHSSYAEWFVSDN